MAPTTNTIGGYEILAELGRGTTGVVYKARHVGLNRLVAITMPHIVPVSDSTIRAKRFVRAARALACLTGKPDANIPAINEVGEHEGLLYSAREFVDGDTLEQCAKNATIDLRKAFRLLAVVAETVQRVHDRGIAHRNLQPSNVLIAKDGTPKLIGFGLVGLLAGWDKLAQGPGVPAQVDVRLLELMAEWLCATLRQPIPNRLATSQQPGSVVNPAEFARLVMSCL